MKVMKPVFISIVLVILFLSGCSNSHKDKVNNIQVSKPTETEKPIMITKNSSNSTENQISSDDNLLRKLAWEQVSDNAKETVIGDWKEASIEKSSFEQVPVKKKDSEKTSNNIYKITFKTTQDELIGAIGIYMDAESNQVVGKDARK